MRKSIIFLLTILWLATSFQGHAGAVKKTDKKPSLYADMARGEDGKYYITRITTQESRINLMTLNPDGFDHQRWDCSRMLFGSFEFSDHKDCVPAGSEFRTSRKRALPTMLLGAATLGASMLFGVIVEESVFDRAAYERALAEAFRNSGLEGKREDLIKKYLSLTETIEDRESELAELFDKYKDDYYNSTAASRVEKKIVDASGLYSGDLYADFLIRVNRNALTELKPPTAASLAINAPPGEFIAIVEAMEASFNNKKMALEAALKNATKDFPVICGPEHLEPYNLRYECPQRITGEPDEIPVAKAIVVSKNITKAMPEVFEAEDAAVKVIWKNGRFYLENKTDERLSITGASLNYRGAQSRSSRSAEMPPLSSIDATALFGLITTDIEKASRFDEMTLNEAEKTPVDITLSVSYEQDSEKKTLTGEKVFRLADLIKKENAVKSRPAALN